MLMIRAERSWKVFLCSSIVMSWLHPVVAARLPVSREAGKVVVWG